MQDRLEADSGEDYPLYMVREAVYDDYYPLLVERFEPYVAGEIDLETGIRRVIEGLDGG